MAPRFLLVLLCTAGLAFSESSDADAPKTNEAASGSESEKQCTACADVPDYGPKITALDSQLQNVMDNLDLSTINGYGAAIGNVKEELAQLSANLETFQKAQAADQRVSTLTDTVQSLQKSLSAVEKALQSKSKDATSSTAAMEEQITALREQIKTEMKAHGESVEALVLKSQPSEDDASSTKAFKSQLAALEKKVGRFEKTHKEMKIGLKAVEKLIAEQSKSIRAVHDSTIGAIATRSFNAALNFVADVGEFTATKVQLVADKLQEVEWKQHFEYYSTKTVDMATDLGKTAKAKVEEVDWKGMWERWTDPKTYNSVVEWFKDQWAYADDWWMNGIQPTIRRQVGDFSVQAQVVAHDAREFVTGHMLYLQMVNQLMPYLEMANIPVEYSGNVVDGLLVLFALSGLWTLKVVAGLFCDCCCPLKQVESQKKVASQKEVESQKEKGAQRNGIKANPAKEKGGRKGRKGSH